jgi:hypothetical protein
MADDETNDTTAAGAGASSGPSEDQPGWAAPGQAPREPAAPAPPGPGDQTLPPPPPEQTASASWQAVPTAPGPAFGAPPSVPRRGGRKWLVVLIALVGATVLMVIAGTALFVGRTLPPYHGAHDFLSDVIHGRASAARVRLCAADRQNAERALNKVARTFEGGTILVNPLDVDRTDDHATVRYSVDLPGTNRSLSYDLPMREEAGRWLACPLSGEG